METNDIVRKFAEDAIKVERVLGKSRIAGKAGRVVFLLDMALRDPGVLQKDVVAAMALRKDVVSKLVGPLVQAGLLTQKRLEANARIKILVTEKPGKALLAQVKAALIKQTPRRMRLPLLDGPY